MKSKKNLIGVMIILAMFSCIHKPENNCNSSTQTNQSFQTDSTVQLCVVQSFLKWYKDNYENINPYELIIYNKNGSKNNFEIDADKFNSFIKTFNKPGFFSEKYIINLKKYILNCEYKFQTNDNMDVPEGFDFDFILITQAIEDTFKAIDNFKILSYERNNFCIMLDTKLCFTLIKENEKWVIDSIYN